MTTINFDGHNLGFQAGVINGSVSTGTSAPRHIKVEVGVRSFNNKRVL